MEERLLECLRIALAYDVTDIHFSMDAEEKVTIEMRVSGVMRRMRANSMDASFFRYLLYRANLDLSNTLAPQTGRFETEVDGRVLSLRMALIASYHLTSGVLRILNNHRRLSMDQLSANPEHQAYFSGIARHRSGLIIISGPTSSGKTTTLYTILDSVKGKKIFTLEDPVEVYSDKYVQLQVNEKQHMGYADGIKQLMRHDPDIIMIGEIRDGTAARMAVRSALTGHLVLTSLHASSCAGGIERMLELGVPEMQLRDVLTGITNQRLYEAAGSRRIGVYEVMDRKEVAYYFATHRTSPEFRTLQENIRQAAEGGIIDRRQAEADLD
jgi:competence protein ComGA